MRVFLLVIPMLAYGQAWQSELFPSAGGHFERRAVSFVGRDWILDDFSYAGYFLGARRLASVPCRIRTIEGSGDITATLQAAIEEVARAGGGTVRIPAGEFTVSSTITITASNISIEGAGSGRTIVRVPDSYKPRDESNEGLFTFGKPVGGWNQGWVHQGPLVTRVTGPVRRGQFHADVADATSIRPGHWVVLQQYFWKDFVDRNSTTPNRWRDDSTDRTFSFTYLRQVVAATGNRILFDAPVPWDLDPANNPVQIRFTNDRMIENTGIRGLTIEFANNSNSAVGRPLGTAVYFEGVRNGWAADIKARNIGRFGLHMIHSARITLVDCEVRGVQDYGDAGYGYGFHVHSSQNILLKRCLVNDARRPFTSQRALTSMLVYSECRSADATQGDDTHHSMIHSVLWDRHTQRDGVNLTAYNRGDFSTGAYESFGSGVVWNFDGDGVRGRISTGGQIHLKPSPDGQAIVIGVNGAHAVFDASRGNPFLAGERISPRTGIQTGSRETSLRNVLYEGIGQPGLEPASLYDALLRERAADPAIAPAEACQPPARNQITAAVNAATSQAGFPLSPGSLATLYGTGLTGPVRIGARQAHVLFSSPTQINVQIPWETAEGTPLANIPDAAPLPVSISAAAPAFFLNGSGTLLAQHPDGTLVDPSAPARPEQTLVLYLTGAGPVDGTLPTGQPVPSTRLFRSTLPAEVTIAGRTAGISFLGLTPGFLGLYQANVVLPSDLPAARHPVRITVGGFTSAAAELPVSLP
ncbi:MAG: hypothetical protein FJW20_02525 [Acidimicrobiia bacterium]|nr:hypothetical protein [Acidimicrobiia bacterium]